MDPHIFFILFLAVVALVGGGVVLFFVLKPKRKSPSTLSEEEVKSHFEDSPLQEVIQSLKQKLAKQYQCPKCQGRKHEAVRFDEDLFEVYCLQCGIKNFYLVDLLAGLNRRTKRTKSHFPKEWLRNTTDTPCPQCRNREFSDFKMDMDVRYKFSGYGDTKKVTLFLNTCKSCGLVNFYDRERA
jgi:predicted nucleic-acid-binding Zn-ribbon protein